MKLRELYQKCRLGGLVGSLALTSCAGFAELEKFDQSQLQKEAVLPDPSITLQNCPAVEQGYVTAYAMPAIREGKSCGHPAPFAVEGISGAQPVQFDPEATLNCVLLSQLHRFFAEHVQPMAVAQFNQPVSSIHVAASYACRSRNNVRGAKLSEHGYANAIDISSLTLADGTVLNVEDDWHSRGTKGTFLRQFNRDACRYFTTVIGPGGDNYHQNHIHLDHGKHGKAGTWRVCQ